MRKEAASEEPPERHLETVEARAGGVAAIEVVRLDGDDRDRTVAEAPGAHRAIASGVQSEEERREPETGEAGDRQVKDGKAKVGLTQNGGGMMRGEAAAMTVHVLER